MTCLPSFVLVEHNYDFAAVIDFGSSYFADLNEKKKAISLYKRGIDELEKGIAIEVHGRGLSLHSKAFL